MELNLRTVLVILGGVVMLGILFDGFRRMRRARQEALKLDVKGDFQFPEEGFSSELPNGGARVIGERSEDELLQDVHNFKDQLEGLSGMSALDELELKADHELDDAVHESLHEERIYAGEPDFQHESYAHADDEKIDSADNIETFENNAGEKQVSRDDVGHSSEAADYASEQLVPKAKPLNLDEHVPLLMDVEELGKELEPLSQARETSSEDISTSVVEDDASGEHIELGIEDIARIEASVNQLSDLMPPVKEIVSEDIIEHEFVEPAKNDHENGRQHAEEMMAQAAYAPVKKPGPNAERLARRSIPSLVLVTHVIPHDEEGFCGEDILYLVNSCDLRHGEKEIFHRFEKESGEGRIQFSMANSFNPGTFNPDTLLHERIHGISLFMSLPGPEKAMDAFEAMTEMASVIARNLGGDVHDETHSIMALQTIEHNRQQVRDFVRKQKLTEKK